MSGGRIKRWFCHYYDNGEKKWSETGGFRIAKEAAALKNADGSKTFDHILSFRKCDLDAKWVAERSKHFQHKRGAGLWVWKPQVIKMTLDRMAPGDELLYCDTGCELKGSVEPLFQLLDKQEIIPFELDVHDEHQWTKGDAFAAVDGSRAFHNTRQRVGGISFWRKGPLAMQLVDEWGKFCDQLHLVSDAPSVTPNYPGFRDHRHDQSGWSLITKKHNIPAIPDITFPPHAATIIAASRRQD